MISLSSPLVLWAPSWNFIEAHANPQVNASIVSDLVERGIVRIAGRKSWINNEKSRRDKAKVWEGARWTLYDEKIKGIANNDKNVKPKQAQRVQIVSDEDGYERADEFLNERPEAINRISRLIKNQRIPEGTLERIERGGLTGILAAREVLRDARNHARAISDAGAEVPFLSLEYGRFVGLINEIDEPINITVSERRTRSIRELARQTLDLLDDLARLGQPDLVTFAGSPAHHELGRWMADITQIVRDKNVIDIEPLILESLRQDIDRHFPEIRRVNTRSIVADLKHPGIVEVLAGVFELLAWAWNPHEMWHWAGTLFVTYKFTNKLLQSFNFIPVDYPGLNWPFLYAFGRSPRLRDIELYRSYLEIRSRGGSPSVD